MMRVVSLLPGATEIVAALGAESQLAGISHECDYPPSVTRLPRVTASAVARDANSGDIDTVVRKLVAEGRPVFAIDADQLRRLAPSVILTQSLCDVCAVSEGDVRDIATVLDPAPLIVPLTGTTLAGVWDDIRRIGAALARDAEANELLERLDARIRRVHETLKAARAPRPRVAVIEWLDPLFAAGHWTPELVKRAGGIDVLAQPGAHSVTIDLGAVRDATPDVIVFAPCGFNVDRAEREAAALLASDEWAWARSVECWAIDGNALTSRPGPRLADAIETMASILAPACFDPPSPAYARRLQGRGK
jgi:iron complex transport system substrate-binding protein